MKNKLRTLLMLGFMVLLLSLLSVSVSANNASETYEPDGQTVTKYEYDSSECDRTIELSIYDEDTDSLIKKVNIKTKKGEDTLDIIKIYGYRLTKFSSNQGLWETCKLGNSQGLQTYGDIYLKYYFRTALSSEQIDVTVYMEKFNDLTLVERHIKQEPYGNTLSYSYYPVTYSRKITTNTGCYVSMGESYTGFTIRSGWQQYISGNFTYKWLDDYENIDSPISSMKWDVIDASCNTTEYFDSFDEDEDGHFTYCDSRLMNCDFEFLRNKYTVSFSANGGSGNVPASQTQFYDYDVTIGTETPIRNGYEFKGWSKNSTATTASYQPGETYTMALNQTLYAVWEEKNYEFSISNLVVTAPAELFPNTTIPIELRADNWDRNTSYDDIPIQLYYDGKLISTYDIDFAEYGVAYIDFYLNVGSSTGTHAIEVRINWNNKGVETNPNNNSVSTTINIISDSYEFSIEALSGNARYKEGTDVMTSYIVYNNGERMVLPKANATAKFTAYYYNASSKVTITNQTRSGVVIPVGESNLVYFKWSVPDDLEGKIVYCECSINIDGKLKEGNINDNTAILFSVIADGGYSQTTNPGYLDEAPSSYYTASAPTVKNGSASWSMWEYQNGSFAQVKYGIKISTASPSIRPGQTCETAIFSGGNWTMKSGYGISMTYSPYITSLLGSTMPSTSAYTGIQTVYAAFPENIYSTSANKYRTLEYYDSYWRFIKNNGAAGQERLHYIPIWVEDGTYQVSVTVTDVWTPAGLVTSVRSSNIITINGSIFDDYYVGG